MGHVGKYAQGIEGVWGELGVCGVGVRCWGRMGGGGEWAVVRGLRDCSSIRSARRCDAQAVVSRGINSRFLVAISDFVRRSLRK